MSQKNLRLRWESTGDQWWFASPIDLAAANGHYDLVRHLIHLDNNLLFKLTSLPRTRRLESLWDDDVDVARCRSEVARSLWCECEAVRGHDALIGAGYGGWLMYAAAAAGDAAFVAELMEREPLLVFGEGEYGVTDVLYAAARGGSGEVFGAVYEGCLRGKKGAGFEREMKSRAVHAAARGGSLGILRELVGDDDVLVYGDGGGATVLHTAAGRAQLQVVKHLISTYDIIASVDDRGNTALNVAAYRGHLAVVEALITASPSLVSLTNNDGDNFLHMVVAGFRTPSFRRLDQQMNLLKRIISGSLVNIEDIINVQNNDGRTPLHMAVIENIQSDIVELIMSARYIDLNLRDRKGNTPLDLLNQRPRTPSSEILIKRLTSAGGIFSNRDNDQKARNALILRLHGIGSPGTSFGIPDSEIILHAGIEDNRRSSCEFLSGTECNYSGEMEVTSSTPESNSSKYKKLSSTNSANGRLKNFLRWLGKKGRNSDTSHLGDQDSLSFKSYTRCSSFEKSPIPLRKQFSRMSSLPSNKRILSLQGNLPSPSSKKRFGAVLSHNVRQVLPKSNLGSPTSGFSESSWSASPLSVDVGKSTNLGSVSGGPSSSNQSPNLENNVKLRRRHGSFNLSLMNNYLCFGSPGIAVEISTNSKPHCENQQSLVV